MKNMEITNLEEIASAVRQKIESQLTKVKDIGPELINFPHSSCEVSTQILGLYLKLKGLENVVACRAKRTSPNRPGEQIHTWLLVNDHIIIDITSDQFSDSESKVIVCKASKFHSTFLSFEPRKISLEELTRPAGISYKDFYQAVVTSLETE